MATIDLLAIGTTARHRWLVSAVMNLPVVVNALTRRRLVAIGGLISL